MSKENGWIWKLVFGLLLLLGGVLWLVSSCSMSGCTSLQVHRRTLDEDGSRTDNTLEYSASSFEDIQRAWAIAQPLVSAGIGLIPGGGTILGILGIAGTAAAVGGPAYGLKKSGDAKAARESKIAADRAWDESAAHHLALAAQPAVPAPNDPSASQG